MRGPNPTPSYLRILNGNPSRRPLNENEPKPKKEMPSCPGHLNKEAKKEWKRISKKLFNLGLLTEIDGQALALYCQAWANWKDACEHIEKTGMIIRASKNNYPILNPYLSIANKAFDQMRMLLSEFGMTPASRSRVGVKPVSQEKTGIKKYLT